ncbi:MAG TPA: hypothetical protein VLY46_03775 [Usitatibacter sp.]|nr:hypothetical protein [Usitatibacter sp.]
MNAKRLALALAVALLAAACNTPPERGVASECGPNQSAAQSCTKWYSGGT